MNTTNLSKILLGAGVFALAATSCSNEIDVNPDFNPGSGRSAYLTVNLHDVNRGTRAGENPEDFDDSNYQDGDKKEYEITNARFFFFDENGIYLCQSSVWNEGNEVGETTDNITLEGNTVVVLENLSANTNPTYMLTVLNGDNFEPSATLEATAQSLWQYKTNDGRFVMTTSSYFDNTVPADPNHDNAYYYATKLSEANFAEGMPKEDTENPGSFDMAGLTPVDVYVERLAGKVELLFDKLSNQTVTYTDKNDGTTHTLYQINATVAGNPNIEGGSQEGVTQLYIEILGWDINSTAPNSYFSKQFGSDFSIESNNPWKNWNNAVDHRSFWAKTVGYGKENFKLNHLTYSGIDNAEDFNLSKLPVQYANEFATTPAVYNVDGQIISSKLTHVILKTRICDEKGNSLDLVRGANGVLYNKANYLQYILNNANIQGKLNLWYLADKTDAVEVSRETLENGDVKITYSSTAKFSQMNDKMAKLEATEGAGTGLIKVVSNIEGLKDENNEDYVWAVRNADGTFTTISYAEAHASLNTSLAAVTGNNGMAYTGGASYYVIPIEHNSYVGKSEADGRVNYNLGYHGFIRNHWYQITLNKIEKIGFGVFNPGEGTVENPGEEIIPNVPENPEFYVTANLKVLAWKIVSQDIDL